MNRQQREKFSSWWQGKILWDAAMADYSTLRAGGRAEALIDVTSQEELSLLLHWLAAEDIVHCVIGLGSNILVPDQGYPGIIIRLQGEIQTITLLPGNEDSAVNIRVGAGCSMAVLVSWCTKQGLSGLEFMTGIPGSVGGAVWMNAGAWGHEIGDQLKQVVLVNEKGRLQQVPASSLLLSYRHLDWQDGDLEQMVIVSADFVVGQDEERLIQDRCREYLGKRKGKQPGGVASAGSFFKNPPGDSAGRLIDAAGLKGTTKGSALVSPAHANFIVNTGGATATEILGLMELVQERVYKQFGIKLEPEVQILQG